MESHNETLQATKTRKSGAESKKSTTTKCQKLTNYSFVVPKATNTDTVTAVSVEEKLADEGHEVQTESHPSQTSKEPTASENVQVHPVTIPVIGDIAPNSPYEQKEIGCSLNSYRGFC